MRVIALAVLFYLAIASLGVQLAIQQQRQVLSLSAQTTATIVEKRLEVSRTHRTTGQGFSYEASYEPLVRYEFHAQARQFTSDSVFPDTPFSGLLYGGGFARSWAEATIARFEPGQEVKAHYDPRNPIDACLIRRPSSLPYLIILLPVLVTSGFLAYFWRAPRTATSGFRRLKARWITGAWYCIGLACASHYFYVAGRDFGASGVILFSGYSLLGLIPLVCARHRRDSQSQEQRDSENTGR